MSRCEFVREEKGEELFYLGIARIYRTENWFKDVDGHWNVKHKNVVYEFSIKDGRIKYVVIISKKTSE